MIGKEIAATRPATLAEVARILERRQGTGGEFGFEQQTTLDYAKRFARLKQADAEELVAELQSLGLSPESAVKIADLLPAHRSQLMLILSKDKNEGAEKKADAVAELVAKYAKKAKKIEPLKASEEPPQNAPAAEQAEGQEGKG
ncbi:MAG: RNA polymerase Rpb4 family protein [Candidatus Micrarchaeota archaeon]|nr:RNA polymerase Rpb4 family protein [Candidatus Micrarchaeota archaeon]